MAEKDSFFQPELDLIFESAPDVPVEGGMFTKNELFHPHLSALLADIMSGIEQDEPKEVFLEPKTSDDPFYIAQLRARELETLANLDQVPVLHPGLPFEQDEVSSSELIGLRAQDELNRLITPGLRNNRLAVSTFILTALEHPSLKQYSHYDDEEVVVSGLFREFIFDKYGRDRTLVVPLAKPRILAPRFLRNMELAAVQLPVLGMGDWQFDTSKN